MPRPRRRGATWGARLLAPAAFLLAATFAVLLVRAGLDADSRPAPTAPAPPAQRPVRTATEPATTAPVRPRRQTYAIQEGETLETVALRFDTTVERLLQLNPSIDPTSLQVGQRIVVP